MTDRVTTAARLVPQSEVTSDDLGRMYRLILQHFEGVTREQFHRDISEKNWTLLIERAGELVGFTTILAYETMFDDAPISVIYSGDTIVSRDAWNTSTLPRAWIESVASLRKLYPRGPYLWLLITSGFRTYRFLPLFWRNFYPRYDSETPPWSKQLLRHIAAERFGDQYDPAGGIVKLRNPQRLRDTLAGIPAGRADDPHIAYFASRNPGHGAGDELACLTELTPENLTPAGRRMASNVPQW